MSEISMLDRRKELSFFDESSARSLVNLLPEKMAKQLRLVWNGELGHLFGLPEPELVAEMRRARHPPAPIDQILRHRFWYEFNRCQDEDWRRPKMDFPLILGRDIGRETFFNKYILNPYKLVYMLTPPVDYKAALQAALASALAQVMDSVDKLKVFDENTGDVKPVAYEKMLKTYEVLHQKVNGLGGAKSKKGQGARALIPEEPPPGLPKSLEEQMEELRLKNEELERLRGAELKKETGAV